VTGVHVAAPTTEPLLAGALGTVGALAHPPRASAISADATSATEASVVSSTRALVRAFVRA